MEIRKLIYQKQEASVGNSSRSLWKKEFFRNSLIHWAIVGSFFVNLAVWLAALFFVRPVDYPIILHYNVYFGVDILGEWWQFYFLPGVGSVFFLVNILMAYFFYERRERIAAYLFLLGAFFVQVGVLISGAVIIRINY
jgi:hypothetical protein